jgi:hypothetical protein
MGSLVSLSPLVALLLPVSACSLLGSTLPAFVTGFESLES